MTMMLTSSQSASFSPAAGNTSAARPSASAVWIIVGASRGIGLEFVRQLLAKGDRVYAVIRDPASASRLWQLAGAGKAKCELLECDVSDEGSIMRFVQDLAARRNLDRIDYVVLNTGILNYPNRASELSFNDFALHLHTNTIGPIITAQKLIATEIAIRCLVFMSSDSGSTTGINHFEDGFAAYAASKAALNQMSRHLAAELQRKRIMTTVLAMHPGEVATDMANVSMGWEVEGIISPEQSVSGMLRVIESKDMRHTGTFWTWEGKVRVESEMPLPT